MLLRDVAAVKRLKQEDGPHLVTQGSTEVVHALLANDLVDEIKIGGTELESPSDREIARQARMKREG